MPKALANRLLHIEIEGSFNSWKKWAVKTGINSKVLGFLSFKPDRLFGFDASNDDLAFPTPRSWEMVSSILNNVRDDVTSMYPLISGLIGIGAAIEFKTWCNIYKEIPSMDDIFNGLTMVVPKSTDAMYALVSSMTSFASENRNDEVKIGNSIKYAQRMPADFAELLIQNYCDLDKDYEKILSKIPEYKDYIRDKGVYRNGNV